MKIKHLLFLSLFMTLMSWAAMAQVPTEPRDTDPCGIATFPWKEDFNSYSNGSNFTPRDCWGIRKLGSTLRHFRIENGRLCLPKGGGDNDLNGTYVALTLPQLTLPSGNYAFSLDIYREADTWGRVEVFVSPDGSIDDLEPLVYISSRYNYNGGQYDNQPSLIAPPESGAGWYTYSVNIPCSGSCYIVLRCYSDASGQSYTPKNLYLDNFSIRKVPTDLAVSNITSTTADISWTPATDETEWIVQYGPHNSFYNGTFQQVTVTGDPSVTLASLDRVQRYHVRVKAVYGSEKSGWSLPLSFEMTPRLTIGRLSTFYEYLPIKCYNAYTYSQQIYTSTELGDAGTIRSVEYFRTEKSPCNRNLEVYMVYTDKEAFESNTDWISVTTDNRVFSGTVNFSGDDWTVIELATPFDYDGQHNVAIIVDDNTGTHQKSTYFNAFTTNTNQTCSRSPYDSNVNPSDPGSGYLVAGKNQIRILKDYPSPTDLHYITLNSTSATLDWTENGTADTWQICINNDENNLVTVYNNKPYTLTGLTLNSDYTIKVRAKCDSSELFSEWSDPISITPSEKTVIGSGSVTSKYLPVNNFFKYCLTQQIYTAAELGAAGVIYSIDFYKNSTSNCTRDIDIYMVNTNKNVFENTTDWISVTSDDLVFSGVVVFANNDWTTIELSVPFAYDGTSNVVLVVDDNTGSYVAETPFRCFNTSADQAIYYYSDGYNYDPTGTPNNASGIMAQKNQIRLFKDETACPKPSSITLASYTDTTATLSWLEYGEATAWQICLNDDESNPIDVTENPYMLTSLVAETTYTAKVRANCGDEQSEWSTSLSFRPTLKTIIGSGSLNSNYLPTSSNKGYSLTQQIYTAAELGDAGFVYSIDFYKTDDNTCNRILDIYMTNTTKSAFQSNSDWIGIAIGNLVFSDTVSFVDNDWTTIELNIPFNYDGTSNVAVVVVDKTGSASSSSSFLTFATTDAQALYIVGNNTSFDPTGNVNSGTRLNMKNQIRFLKGEAPSCPIPMGLTLVSSTCTTATLRWTENGAATAWQICLNDDETNLIDVTENPCLLTGLVTDSTYTAKVRANCGDEQSGWSYPLSFTPIHKVVVGSGSAWSNYLPTYNLYNYSLTQQIYTAAELGGAGLIQSIDFYKNSTNETNRTMNIYMVNTDKSTFESTTDWISVTSDDLVFSGTINFADNDWSTIELPTPFEYDGTSNIAVVVDDNTGNYVAASHFLCFDALTSQAIYYYSDDTNYDPTGTPGGALGVMTMKNQIRLFITPYRPTNLTYSAVTAGTVTLNWIENGEATAWQICLNGDETNLIEATSNPFTVTDLVGASDYTVKVRSNYGYIQSEWSDPVSFSTPCGIATFPWKEDFNSYSNGSYFTPQNGPCWAYQDLNNTYRRFRVENGALCLPHGEASGVLNGTTCTLRLPELTLPSDNYAFSFDVYRESSTKGEVKVYVSQTGSISNLEPLVYISTQYNYNGGYYSNDPSVIVPPENASGWYTYSVNIPYSGSCYVILYCESDWAGQNYTPKNLYLDNFSIREVPSDLAVSNITSTTADISWTPATDETEWIVQYGPYNSFYNGTFQQVTVTGNPSVTLGLDPVLRYHVRVKAVYGSEKSGWSLPLSFDMTPRHTVGRLSTFYAYLPIKCYNYYTYSQQIYTPAELGDAGTIRSIDFFRDATSPCNRNLDVYMVYTDKEAFESNTDWISVTTNNRVFSGTVNFSAQDWTAIELSQPFSYDGLNNVAIIVHDKTGVHQQSSYFYGIGANTNQTCIRSTYDSSINPSSPGQGSLVAGKNQIRILKDYPTPTNLVCTAITTTTATIDWTENGTADTWQICLNDDESNFITVYSYNKPYTLTGLTLNSDYTIKVRAKCDNSYYSAWSDICSFSTTATLPYSTDYESTCDWRLLNGDCTNQWRWGTAAHNGEGTHGIYISNDSGTTNAYTTTSEAMVYAYKSFEFEAGFYEISYDWNAMGESSYDYLRVALVPDTITLEAGIRPLGFSYSGLPDSWIALDGDSQLNMVNEWQTEHCEVEVPVSGIYKMVFAWRNDSSSGTTPPAAIDNVSIIAVSCTTPVNFVATNLTARTADLSWTTLLPTDSYTVKYRTSNIVFKEGFEGGAMPLGWTQSGPGTWRVTNGYDYNNIKAHSGTYNARINHQNREEETFLITPMLDLSGQNDLFLDFWYINHNWGASDIDQLYVYYRVDEGEWVELWNTPEDHQVWTECGNIALPNPSANYQIGFKMVDKYGHGVGIDDIVVWKDVPAGEWQSVTVAGGTTEVSATLAGLSPETPYEVYVYPDCDPSKESETIIFTTLEQTMLTQTIALASGVNWVSFNVETTLDSLKAALVEAMPVSGVTIAAKDDGQTFYNGTRWRGALASLDMAQMYRITVPAACEIVVEDMPVDPASHPITIKSGLNWIAYPFMESMTITDAFAGFAVSGDEVRAKDDGIAKYVGTRWRGALTHLVPGQGYIYNSAVSGNRTFTFPTSSGK